MVLQLLPSQLCSVLIDCWHQESHQRPTFAEILHRLEEISTSPFMTTPQESFHTMQEDWRQEIEEMFNELRSKEKVVLQEFHFINSIVHNPRHPGA